ncbi:hypothetical protein V2O64_16620 [Verrucomicrobiaceae bacterium 227]
MSPDSYDQKILRHSKLGAISAPLCNDAADVAHGTADRLSGKPGFNIRGLWSRFPLKKNFVPAMRMSGLNSNPTGSR